MSAATIAALRSSLIKIGTVCRTRNHQNDGASKRQEVGGDQDGAPLVALAEDLEEEFRASGGQGDEAQFVDDEKLEAGQLPLEVEQSSLIPGPSGPLYLVFTGATPQCGSPAWFPSQ